MRDYTRYSFLLSLLVIAGLVCISFIPPFSVGGVKFKRANIFSELYSFPGEEPDGSDAGLRREDLDFIREMQDAADYAEEGEGINEKVPEEEVPAAPVSDTWDLGSAGQRGPSGGRQDPSEVSLDNVTPIEDYSGNNAVLEFSRKLEAYSCSRNIRIAFFGDSFIEGDIITADVREQLQGLYGGHGVGFVPLSSVTAEYRPTVKHSFRGWKDYQVANKKTVPEEYRDRFLVSGTISVPTSAAWADYETTTFRKYISEVSNLRFFYSSTAPAEIKITVNGEHERTFDADTTGQLRQINIAGSGFRSMRVDVPATDGFAGYGVSLEGSNGVIVDNYSIRSSTELSLFGTSAAVNSAYNRMMGYDLIVLQYGLNIMSAEVTGYSSYGEQLRNLVNYIKRCFPSTAIIVMGVGDRSMQQDGDFVTMPAVSGLLAEQRAVARDCGVAFWNTYQAIGGYNSMKRFADWGWAAKDYTHLSFAGGRKIATEFVKALEYAKTNPYTYGEEPSVVNGEPGNIPESPDNDISTGGPDDTEPSTDRVDTVLEFPDDEPTVWEIGTGKPEATDYNFPEEKAEATGELDFMEAEKAEIAEEEPEVENTEGEQEQENTDYGREEE